MRYSFLSLEIRGEMVEFLVIYLIRTIDGLDTTFRKAKLSFGRYLPFLLLMFINDPFLQYPDLSNSMSPSIGYDAEEDNGPISRSSQFSLY